MVLQVRVCGAQKEGRGCQGRTKRKEREIEKPSLTVGYWGKGKERWSDVRHDMSTGEKEGRGGTCKCTPSAGTGPGRGGTGMGVHSISGSGDMDTVVPEWHFRTARTSGRHRLRKETARKSPEQTVRQTGRTLRASNEGSASPPNLRDATLSNRLVNCILTAAPSHLIS